MRRTVRVAVAVVALLVAACNGASQPVTGAVYDEFCCKVGCDRCAPEAQCISSPYISACLSRCTGAADCSPAEKCTLVAGSENRSPVCLTTTALMVCHAPDCQIIARCRDDSMALKPLPRSFTACGWELVHCDSGCDPTTGDCK
jgi:hypothetical protein